MRRLRTGLAQAAALSILLTPLSTIAVSAEPATVRDVTSEQVDQDKLRQALASRTLTWLTGSASNNDYISVGRLANFFGFVALRVSSGHSLSRSQIAKETLAVLDRRQVETLVSLVEDQSVPLQTVNEARFAMNRALEGLLLGETLSEEDFLLLGETYGEAEAALGFLMAERFGDVAASLTSDQREAMRAVRTAYQAGQISDKKTKGTKTRLSKEQKKELVNVTARLLSWTTGTSELNDYGVVGKPSQHFGFVSLRIESNHSVKRGAVGAAVLDILSPAQSDVLEAAAQSNAVAYESFMASRQSLMRGLEAALLGEPIDAARVREAGRAMGRHEAKMTWQQAQAMLAVRRTLTDDQVQRLLDLRATYTSGRQLSGQDTSERGRQLYAQCIMCHSDGSNAIAPSLRSIVGREVAGLESYAMYSPAMQNFAQSEGAWSETTLDLFLRSPRTLVPGTTMGYSGLSDAGDRQALIAYLQSLD